MAIYHLSIKIFSRGKGKSAVAAAAYRAGEKITNEYDGITHDYTRKGGVIHTEILLSENAPSEYQERSLLWNAVEKSERYKTAQLAREIEIALPVELTAEQSLQLVREYVKSNFVSAGMCADIAIHDTGKGNPHAHIMLTMRPLEKDGKWGQKSRTENGVKIPTVDWNDKDKAEQWRQAWGDICNEYLLRNERAERIDHRSFKRQGKEEVPTVHLGAAVCQMERRGIKTERGNINRAAEVTNSELKQLKSRIRKCNEWIYSQPIEDAPKMINVMNVIASGKNLNTMWQKVADLKTRANVLMFLQSNHITDVSQLAEKVTTINEEFYEVTKKIKKVDRRLETLDKHIEQADIYFEYKAIYKQYSEIQKPKKQAEFREKHAKEITLFENAKEYVDGVMNGKRPIPRKTWRAERETLTAERFSLCENFYRLKDETRNVEVLRRGVESLMKEQAQRNEPTKKRDMEI